MAWCHLRCFTAATASALGWFRYTTVTHWASCSMSLVFKYFPQWWLHSIPSVAPHTGVALCHFTCLIFTNRAGFAWSQVSHCHSLMWLCVIPGVWLPLSVVVLCHLKCLTATHLGSPISFQIFSAAYLGDFMSFKMSHCSSLRWLCVVQCFPLLLKVVLHHSKWLIATHCSCSVLFQLFDCQLRKLVCVVLCVSLLLTRGNLHCLMSPTGTSCGV